MSDRERERERAEDWRTQIRAALRGSGLTVAAVRLARRDWESHPDVERAREQFADARRRVIAGGAAARDVDALIDRERHVGELVDAELRRLDQAVTTNPYGPPLALLLPLDRYGELVAEVEQRVRRRRGPLTTTQRAGLERRARSRLGGERTGARR